MSKTVKQALVVILGLVTYAVLALLVTGLAYRCFGASLPFMTAFLWLAATARLAILFGAGYLLGRKRRRYWGLWAFVLGYALVMVLGTIDYVLAPTLVSNMLYYGISMALNGFGIPYLSVVSSVLGAFVAHRGLRCAPVAS